MRQSTPLILSLLFTLISCQRPLSSARWSHDYPPSHHIQASSKVVSTPSRTVARLPAMNNAQLMAAGLSPNRPAKFGQGGGRSKRPGSGPHRYNPQPSGYPHGPVGRIVVRCPRGILGFVSRDSSDNDGAYHITSDATSAAQFARPPSETKGFNLAVMGQDEFFGAIGGRRDASSRSPLFAGLSRVANHNGQPIKERDENKETETQIWSINPNTLELTATWQSVDGSVPAKLFRDNTYADLGMTDDLDKFRESFDNEDIEAVEFYFQPI